MVSMVRVLEEEGIYDTFSHLFDERNLIIPLDFVTLNLFVIIHLANCDYVGRNALDFWQHFIMGSLPFAGLVAIGIGLEGHMYSRFVCNSWVGQALAIIALYQLLYFLWFLVTQAPDELEEYVQSTES